MKNNILLIIFAALLCLPGMAQTKPDTFIKGEMNVRFDTRIQTDTDGKPKAGATDKYTLSVNISNSALFHGTISQRPNIDGGVFGNTQTGLLSYAVDCDVVNPKNPAQTRNVGKLYGTIPVDKNNVYRFADGNLTVNVFGMGSAKGFDSKFSGLALGKPPAPEIGAIAKMKQSAMSITKSVNGKATTIIVNKYDKMEFRQHVLAAGPVQIYPDINVNGSMLYDYGRSAWYFQGVTVTYAVEGRQMQDSLTGNIRWVETPDRKTTGEGEYDFDIRVNEPPPSESAVFDGPKDESAFFDTDNSASALTGTMKYKDTITGDDNVTSSNVQIALIGNKLTKQQTMYLAKLIFFSMVVPLNAE